MTSPNERTVVVHATTGAQGHRVAARAAAAGWTIREAHRQAEIPVDLDDRDSLVAAYRRADAVVVQLPLVFDARALRYAENIVAAVDRAGVGRVVFNANSPVSPAPIGVPYVDARTLLHRRLGDVSSSTTISPAGPYMENLSAPGVGTGVLAGTLGYPLPEEAPVPWLAIDDLADAVVSALDTIGTSSEHRATQILSGPEALTGSEVARSLTAVLGRSVAWTTITAADFGRLLEPQVGLHAAEGISAFYAGPPAPSPPPEMVTHGATTLAEWAARTEWPKEVES
jgi:uncharacterized protein YbjT (DUF2867 family)